MSRAARPTPIADLIFGTDPRMRIRTRLCLLASLVYCVWIGVSWFALQHGMFINRAAAIGGIALQCLQPLLIYPMVRSGKTMHWADPALVLTQMVLSYIIICYTYAIAPDVRGALLQVMCLTQVFGLFSLTPKEIKISGISAVASLVIMLLMATQLGLPQFDPAKESIAVLLAGFIVSLLGWTSHKYAMIRFSVRQQKKELANAVEKVNQIIMHDALTGLFNRRHMQELLEREYARTQRTGNNYCIALIDLDHFKRVNDTYGHNVGDDVLVGFARAAQRVLRETDIIARWGGEEFLVLMPDTFPEAHAQAGLGRLRDALKQEVVSTTEPTLRVNFSAGVAVHVADESMDHALERADQALYRAKAEGRDRHVLAELTAHH